MKTEEVRLYRGDIDDVLFDELTTCQRIAWDIETSGLDWRADHIGTCQIYAPEVGAAVVQLDASPPSNLRRLLEDESVQKVFHHAPFDLRFMAWAWKASISNVGCTKIASKVLEPEVESEQHTLQALLHRHLSVSISKDERTSDWLIRDLSPAQLDYAVKDVVYLLPLLDVLTVALKRAGLYSLFRGCLAHLPVRVELDLAGYPDVFAY